MFSAGLLSPSAGRTPYGTGAEQKHLNENFVL
jgi:hypothetical protein